MRGDSAYGNSAVVAACRRSGARLSLALAKNTTVAATIAGYPPMPGHRCAIQGGARSRHRGVDLRYRSRRNHLHAFGSTDRPVTARLIVRRVEDARCADGLFPVSRYHPFFTDSDEPVDQADITHRRHAIIETVLADPIDGPLAHLSSGRFGANSAWALCATIAHNLLRATATLAGDRHAVAHGATLRRKIVDAPARLTRPQRRPALNAGVAHVVSQHHRLVPTTSGYTRMTTRRKAPTGARQGKLGRPAATRCPPPDHQDRNRLNGPTAGSSVDRG